MKKGITKRGIKKAIALTAAFAMAVTSNGFGMTGGGIPKPLD